MNNFYTQHDIAKLCGETDTAVSRVLGRSPVCPSITVGLRLLFSETQKDQIVALVGEYRRRVPKIPRTKKAQEIV